MSMRKLTLSVFSMFIVLTACSSGSEEAATGDEAPTTTTEAPTTTEASTTTTEAPVDPANSEYCRHSQAADLLDEEFDAYDDPVALENYFIELNGLLFRAIEVAPPEIVADLEIIKEQVVAVGVSTAAYDYEFSAMLEAIERHTSDEADAAYDVVNAYDEAACGIEH